MLSLLKYKSQIFFLSIFSPPGTGVIPSCLCYGMFDLGMIGGTGAEFLNGLEAVLGSGELVRVGSCSISNQWYGRQPLPDLAGLFIGWEGTTGIVTKAAIKLWPKLPYREDFAVIAQTVDQGVPMLLKLSKAGLGIVDIVLVNMGWCQAIQGFDEKSVAKDPVELGLPDFIGLVTTQAYTEEQHKAQCDAIKALCREFEIEPTTSKAFLESFPSDMRGVFLDMFPDYGGHTPIQAWGCWNFARGGGGEWIGSYCSTSDITRYYNLAREIIFRDNYYDSWTNNDFS